MKILLRFILIIFIFFLEMGSSISSEEDYEKDIIIDIRRVRSEWLREDREFASRQKLIVERKNLMKNSILQAVEILNNIPNNENIRKQALKLEDIAEFKSNSPISNILERISKNTSRFQRTIFTKKSKSKKNDKIIILSKGGATFDADSKTATFEKSKESIDQVRVVHPQFDMLSNKLVVFLNKDSATSDIKKAEASGSVEILKENPDGTRVIAVAGRAEFNTETQRLYLSDWPEIQKGNNKQKALSKNTMIVIDQNGKISTKGPTKVTIIQEKSKDALKPRPREVIKR